MRSLNCGTGDSQGRPRLVFEVHPLLPALTALTGHFPPGQFGRYLAVGVWNTLFGCAAR